MLDQNILILTTFTAIPLLCLASILLFVARRRRKRLERNYENSLRQERERREKIEERYATISEIEARIAELERNYEDSLRHERERRREIEERYSGISDIAARVDELERERGKISSEIEAIRATYAEKRALLHQLERQIALYDEKLAFAELGVYEPHFDFGESAAYKERINEVRARQKAMVAAKRAVTCATEWAVEGSRAKGQTMTNRQIRLTLRAFNNECEAAIANARWNNVNAMERRITHAATQINKMNASSHVIIETDYLSLKLEELYLVHERREAQKRERDERAETARLAREEQKLIREAEAAEAEEERYRSLLDKARAEAANAQGAELERLQSRMEGLQTELEKAHNVSERARSMAEMTRTGFVYIISNVGSFGEDVVKIGLTRRLDPEDRVRELGDASVPFTFDTHALIYSEDAPALESALHAQFQDRRINSANMRKEFFRVTLDEVEAAVVHLAPQANFIKDREAQDYYETLARRREEADRLRREAESKLPEEI